MELARPFAGSSPLDVAGKSKEEGKAKDEPKSKSKPVDAKDAALATTLQAQAYKGLCDVYTATKNKVCRVAL